MSETTTSIKELEAAVTSAKHDESEAMKGYQVELAKGVEADFTLMQAAMNKVVASRQALKAATAAVDKAAANVRWTELVNVNRGLVEIVKGLTLPTASATGFSGSATIAEDGSIKVTGSFTWKLADFPVDAISAFVKANVAEYDKRKVTGLNFKLTEVTHEDGSKALEPSVSPVGVIAAGTPKTKGTKAVAGEGGKGSNEYVDAQGNVHTAREAIAALRDTYKGKQESIDNALTTGNGVRNIAMSLCGQNGWVVRKSA